MIITNLSNEKCLPVDRIPNEILADILEIAAANEIKPLFQLVVGRVCRRWRNLVLNLPLFMEPIAYFVATRPEFIRLCLQRSKELPIDIHITAVCEMALMSITTDKLQSFVDQLIPQSLRWRCLVVDAYHVIPLCFVMRSLWKTQAPRLEHIDLRCTTSFHARIPSDFLD